MNTSLSYSTTAGMLFITVSLFHFSYRGHIYYLSPVSAVILYIHSVSNVHDNHIFIVRRRNRVIAVTFCKLYIIIGIAISYSRPDIFDCAGNSFLSASTLPSSVPSIVSPACSSSIRSYVRSHCSIVEPVATI